MNSKYFIDWDSTHILKLTKNHDILESRSYDVCYNVYINHFQPLNGYNLHLSFPLTESFDRDCIYATASGVYYFDGKVLQCGSKDIYNMRKIEDNVYSCENIFLIVEDFVLYIVKIDRLNEFYDEIVNYYPITELIFLYAMNAVKFYSWRKFYDKVDKRLFRIQKDRKNEYVKCWMNFV